MDKIKKPIMIASNINNLKKNLPEHVDLVAVSKTKPAQMILEAMTNGHLDFGENKVQELVNKYEMLPKTIKWHMIGHLQRNKVKYIAPFVHLIHGVDSERLLREINKQAKKHERKINCLLQFHIATENTKFGFSIDEIKTLINQNLFNELQHVNICGVMGMATFTTDTAKIKEEFIELNNYFKYLTSHFDKNIFNIVSMGMSGDYQLAISCGSTMVRVGSAIFGERN